MLALHTPGECLFKGMKRALVAPVAPAVLQKRGELEAAAAEAVRRALASQAAAGGDVLVFLPGVAEIRRTQRLLQQEGFIRNAGVAVQQLHGGLAPQQQDEVIRWVIHAGSHQLSRVVWGKLNGWGEGPPAMCACHMGQQQW